MPGAGDPQLWYEHAHRYRLAHRLARGARVLDVGSGEGYGVALLAEVALDAVGVDIDPQAVAHAAVAHRGSTARFLAADARRLPFHDGAVDLVTCFEMIEHVVNPEPVLDELARVVTPSGLVVLSTPDAMSSDGTNPFHLRELTAAELEQALSMIASSVVWPLEARPGRADAAEWLDLTDDQEMSNEDNDGRWRSPTYIVAICSHAELPHHTARASILDDPADELWLDLRAQIERAQTQLASYEADLATRAAALADADVRLRTAAATIAQHEAELSARATALHEFETRHASLGSRASWLAWDLAEHQRLLAALQRERDRDRASLAWRLVSAYRSGVQRALPPTSIRRRSYERVRGRVSRRVGEPAATGSTPDLISTMVGSITLSTDVDPVASIIIPVHGKLAMTMRCLRSIAAFRGAVPYEVVLVDDASPDLPGDVLAHVGGVRLIRNKENLGYLDSTRVGVERSKGEFVVLLNNDTEVHPGWLDALVETARSDPSIGAVGGRMVYPDGRLQEAGSIVFSDGRPLLRPAS